MSLDKYRASLPFVQRIINSNYSDRLRISASQMLFGNMLNLGRGIFVNIPDSKSAMPLSKHLDSLLSIQENLLQASAKELLQTDEICRTRYPEGLPTR